MWLQGAGSRAWGPDPWFLAAYPCQAASPAAELTPGPQPGPLRDIYPKAKPS